MATKTWAVTRDARTGDTYGAGKCDHLSVGSYGGEAYESWLGFSLSFSGIPSAASISSAVLHIKSSDHYHVAPDSGTLLVSKCSAFVEGTASHPMNSNGGGITGADEPAVSGSDTATKSITTAANTWYTITITNLVKNQWWGQTAGYLRLHANSGVFEFWARESGSSNDAYIVVTYNPNSVPSAPTLNSPVNGGFVGETTPTLNFTPNDPDGDAHTKYTYQVDDDSLFASPVESVEVVGSLVNAVPVNRVVGVALTRGLVYYWRVKTADAANGYGPYSSARSFVVGNIPVVSAITPNQGHIARLYYDAGSQTTPKLRPMWLFTDADGHAQSQCLIRIYADNAGSQGTLLHTHTYDGPGNDIQVSGLTLTNLAYYWVSFQVTCAGGIQAAASTAKRFRVIWSRASYYYNVGATPPVAWAAPDVVASGSNVVEWSASTSTSEPSTYYASFAEVPLPNGPNNFLWHRVTQMVYADDTGVDLPELLSVTLKWASIGLVADNWTYGSAFSVDAADQKYGTQSLKGTCAASAVLLAYQAVPVQPNTDYILSGYIKSSGNSQAMVRVDEPDGASVIARSFAVTGTQDFTRHSTPVFNSGSRTKVNVVSVVSGVTGTRAWFDALKLEASSVVTPWTPGFMGGGSTIDAGGVQVDASRGGVFRLRGSTGGLRDVVELGSHGLRFGGDVEQSSPDYGQVQLDGPSTENLALRLNAAVGKNAALELGSGETIDVAIRRAALKTVTFDDGAGGGIAHRTGSTTYPMYAQDGDMFYRTDRKMWFFWSTASNRWLSDTIYRDTLAPSNALPSNVSATSAGLTRHYIPNRSGLELWLETYEAGVYVSAGGTALAAGHKWVGTLHAVAADATNQVVATITFDSGTAGRWYSKLAPVNITDPTVRANINAAILFHTTWTKTGTPGNLFPVETITYRLAEASLTNTGRIVDLNPLFVTTSMVASGGPINRTRNAGTISVATDMSVTFGGHESSLLLTEMLADNPTALLRGNEPSGGTAYDSAP